MEHVHGTRKQSESVQEEDDNDVISRMPDNVITNILDRLPIQDAVRTDILSKNWRFKWNMLSQLEFDMDFFLYLARKRCEKHIGRIIISRLLLQLKGAITKFYLFIHEISYFEDINNWVMFLSTKGIEDLTLVHYHETPLNLPNHLFSCLKLKHLKLGNCCISPMPSFRGFPNLLSLDLFNVRYESCKIGEFLTRCPLLEILKICFCTRSDLTPLPYLKTLELCNIDLRSDAMVSCAIELIFGFPNLKFLKITPAYDDDAVPPPAIGSSEVEVDCSFPRQLQLQEVSFCSIRGLETEVCLIKSLLASSPLLKKIVIEPHLSDINLTSDDKLMFAKKLLKLHRASPIAEIELNWLC